MGLLMARRSSSLYRVLVVVALSVASLGAKTAHAQSNVEFDPTQTRLFVTVRAGVGESTLILPASGSVSIDWAQSEGLVRFRDLHFVPIGLPTDQFWVNVPVQPAGDLVVNISHLTCTQAPAQTFTSAATVDGGGNWSHGTLPVSFTGNVSYFTDALVCMRLQNQGGQCQLSASIAAGGAFNGAMTLGTLTATPGGARITGTYTATRPFVVGSSTAGSMTVSLRFVGETTQCAADFNSDDTVSADDIFIFLDAWFAQAGGSGAGLTADINADGAVSADDIFAFLDLWFSRCE